MEGSIIVLIAKKIVILQVVLIILLVILTFVLSFLKKIYLESKAKNSLDAENFIRNMVLKIDSPWGIAHFPKKWAKLEILLPIIKTLDKDYRDGRWIILKKLFVEQVVLPLARKAAFSRLLMNRFYAAEAFSISSDKEDEYIMQKLIKDKIVLVRYNIIGAAVNSGEKSLIHTLIRVMINERSLTQSIYLEAFGLAPPETIVMVEDQLNIYTNPYARATCYKILSKYYKKAIRWDIKPDLYSDNMALQISALKFYVHVKKNEALPTLLEFLNSKHFEVQVVSLHLLGYLNATETIPNIIPLLKDQNWWVRFVSAQTLKEFGDIGIKALQSEEVKAEHFAFDVSKHILESD